ncbi:hypothetical protein Tco_0778144 [Tanacetum coccineum]
MEAYVDDMVIKSMDEEAIKANPAKIQALTSLKRPKSIKEVQSLNGKLAALNRFLSKCVKKSLPFFKMLKGCLEKKDFTWTREADKAFEEMKRAQILVDFLVETQEEDEETDFQNEEEKGRNTGWKLYTDGESSDDGFRAGLMIDSPEGMEFTYALKLEYTAINNEAE